MLAILAHVRVSLANSCCKVSLYVNDLNRDLVSLRPLLESRLLAIHVVASC